MEFYQAAQITPVELTTGSTELLVGTPNLIAGTPKTDIYVKMARLHVRSLSGGGSIIVGGDTAGTSPVVLKANDVGEYVFPYQPGIGLKITTEKSLYAVVSGTADATLEVGYHRVVKQHWGNPEQ